MQLDMSSPVPLYHQLQDILRSEIARKVHTVGGKLPSEHELCRAYGVTRPTVRQALEGLVREGLVHKHRGKGAFVARASVQTEVTGLALKEMLSELEKMAQHGLTADEVEKVRAQDRAAVVQTYETVDSIAQRLASLAMLGLPPSFDVQATRARQAATEADLNALARSHVGPSDATIVVVGPSEKVLPQLEKLGLGAPQMWDPEGVPLPQPKK